MIWRFEGGPWDGLKMPAWNSPSLAAVLAPQQQIVETLAEENPDPDRGAKTNKHVYELTEATSETATYRILQEGVSDLEQGRL